MRRAIRRYAVFKTICISLGYNGYPGRSTIMLCKPEVSYIGDNFNVLSDELLDSQLEWEYTYQVLGADKVS